MKILIADDSPVSRTVLQRMVESWGYEVVPCADGLSAWSMLVAPDAPELAILDWVMPGMDGIEVCRRLRALPGDRHVFVYLLTARSSNDDVLEGLEAGADDYLTKPVAAPELRVRLRNGRRLVELHRQLIRAREALRTQAMVDPLTGLFNRRAFTDLAGKELARAERTKRPVGLLMIDLDHFKRINDEHGHLVGDAVLTEVARRARGALRQGDLLARIGGEELVALLPECSASAAFAVGERIRAELARAPVRVERRDVRVTASLGAAASARGDESLEGLMARADHALYVAKRAGRDRCVVAAPAEVARVGAGTDGAQSSSPVRVSGSSY